MSSLSDFKGDPIARKPARGSRTAAEASESRKAKLALLRRAKNSEREFARWMVAHDGPDPKYRHLTSSTGRIGQVTGLRADTLSRTFLGEEKNMKLNATLAGYWQLINEKAIEFRKSPILHWSPSNAASYKVSGKPLPDLYIIDRTTLQYLLDCRRRVEDGTDA